MPDNTNKSFSQILWDLKLPQYLGTYFAIGFGILQFVEFITKRYDFSEVLVDKYLLIWLSMVPAIIVLIYFKGELKFEKLSLKWPKLLVLSNLCISLLLATFLFNTKSDNQTTIVEVIDEEGEKINAVVPVLNKVKTVAAFQFKNLTTDPENDWYGIAFSELLYANLIQRPEFYVYSAYSLNTFHDVLGLPSFVVPSIGMQREIARKSQNDYFTNISYTIKEDVFEFKGHLYSSKDGKKIIELSAVNTDLFVAIDEIKKQIFDNIPNPIQSKKNQMYMPSSALLTSNLEALEYHTKSRITFYNDPTALEKTLELERKAVEQDASCAECHYYVGDVLYGLGRREEAIVSLKQAIMYGKALPERMQFRAKNTLYGVTNNMDAFYKLQEVRIKMFPYEFQAYQSLASQYLANDGIEKAKTIIQKAIDNGNTEKGLLALSKLQLGNDENTEALATLDRYNEAFPDRNRNTIEYANIHEKLGDLETAKNLLIEEEAIDPLNANIQVKLAVLDFKSQDFVAANERIEQGLSQATTLTDSLNFLWTKSYLFENSGQIENAFKTIATYEKYVIKRSPINRVIVSTFSRKAFMNQSIGQSGRNSKLLAELAKYAPQSESTYSCVVATNAIQNDFDIDMSFNDFNTSCRKAFETYGEGYLVYFDIIVAYQKQEYNRCVELIENDNSKALKLIASKIFISQIYAKSGDFEKAKSVIKKEIDQKTDQAGSYYQMAVLLEDENPKQAKSYLDIALKYWANADASYIPLQRANVLANRLEGVVTKIKL